MATLPQLKTFVTVVDQGGFTAAARRLGLSQPATSRAVATLEKELGLPLLNRGRDGLSLTTAGTTALMHAREALRHMTLMHSEVASLAGDVTGTLSIASPPTVTASVITPQLREFAERHPAVEIGCSKAVKKRCGTGSIKVPQRPEWSAFPHAGCRPRLCATNGWSPSRRPTAGWRQRKS